MTNQHIWFNIYYMTIMKNRITTTITTMMLMLFSYGINMGGLSGGLSFWYNHFPLLMTYIPAVARAPAMIYFQ